MTSTVYIYTLKAAFLALLVVLPRKVADANSKYDCIVFVRELSVKYVAIVELVLSRVNKLVGQKI